MRRQKEIGKIADVKEPNEDLALDFAGPFRNAKKGKSQIKAARIPARYSSARYSLSFANNSE